MFSCFIFNVSSFKTGKCIQNVATTILVSQSSSWLTSRLNETLLPHLLMSLSVNVNALPLSRTLLIPTSGIETCTVCSCTQEKEAEQPGLEYNTLLQNICKLIHGYLQVYRYQVTIIDLTKSLWYNAPFWLQYCVCSQSPCKQPMHQQEFTHWIILYQLQTSSSYVTLVHWL